MHVDLRIHPAYLVSAGVAWTASVAGVALQVPHVFEAGLLASVAALGVGSAFRHGPPAPKLAPLRTMVPGGALKSPKAPELAGTTAPRGGPGAPPTVAPGGSALDPIELEVVGTEAPPAPTGVPWARAESARGPLMFEGSRPLASEANRRVWAARDPMPKQASVGPDGVIHGVCGRCGTRISVQNKRPVWATCPVCGHSKLLN